jgi:hypothetical protein
MAVVVTVELAGAWTLSEVGAVAGAGEEAGAGAGEEDRAEEEPNMRDKVLFLFSAGFCS